MLLKRDDLSLIRSWIPYGKQGLESLRLQIRIDFLWHMYVREEETEHVFLCLTDDEASLLLTWYESFSLAHNRSSSHELLESRLLEHVRLGGDPLDAPLQVDDDLDTWNLYNVQFQVPIHATLPEEAAQIVLQRWEDVKDRLAVSITKKDSVSNQVAIHKRILSLEDIQTLIRWFHTINNTRIADIRSEDAKVLRMCQRWEEQVIKDEQQKEMEVFYTKDTLRVLLHWYEQYDKVDVSTRRDYELLSWLTNELGDTSPITVVYEVDVYAEKKEDVLAFLQEDWFHVIGSIRTHIVP